MVSIVEAAEGARKFACAVLGPEHTQGVRLEEIDSSTIEGGDAWIITLSMINPDVTEPTTLASVFRSENSRVYKTFTVMKETGEIKSMKIRTLAGA